MAIISTGKATKSVIGSMKYVQFEKKSSKVRVQETYGINCSCNYKLAADEFNQLEKRYGKEGGRRAHHMVLSFSDTEMKKYSNQELMDKAIDIASFTFPNHQIWLGMHTDTDHTHVHMIIGSINMENGKKLQINGRQGMYEIMNTVQKTCKSLGLEENIVGKRNCNEGNVNTKNPVEWNLIKKGKSWKLDMALKINYILEKATSKSNFIKLCNEQDIICDWSEKKHIIFTDKSNYKNKVRANNLSKTFNLSKLESKESILEQFENNNLKNFENLNTLDTYTLTNNNLNNTIIQKERNTKNEYLR